MKRIRRYLIPVGLVAVIVIILPAVWSFLHRSPVTAEEFLKYKGELREATVMESMERGGVVTEELLLESSTGLTMRARLKYQADLNQPRPAFLLVGGLQSGRRCLDGLDAIRFPLVWMSIDYPYTVPDRFPSLGSLFRELDRAQEGGKKTVAGLCLALDYLESRPEVDAAHTGLGGGSLGAYPVIVAGAIDPRFEAVAALYAGAPLYQVVGNTLKTRSWAARTGITLFLKPPLDQIDPLNYVSDISPRSFLMVNGKDDTLIPEACVQGLYAAALQPKHIQWVETPHVIQGNPERIALVAEVAVEWLGNQGW